MKRLLILVSVMLAAPLQAETLDLDSAISRAWNNDKRISEKQRLVEHAEAQRGEVDGAKWPTVDLTIGVGLAPDVEGGLFKEGQGGNANGNNQNLKDDTFSGGVGPWYFGQFSIIQPLYSFGKFKNYAAAADGQILVKQGDVEIQRGDTAIDTSRAYFGLLASRGGRYLLEEARKRLEGAIDIAEELINSNSPDVSQADLYALSAGIGLIDKFHAEAVGLEATALAGLSFLTGLPESEIELADKRLKALPFPKLDLEGLQQQALRDRPEMGQLAAGISARTALVGVQRTNRYPNIFAGIVGTGAYSPDREDLDNPYITDPFNQYGATPIVGMQWKWETGRSAAKIEQAEAELNALLEKDAFANGGIPFEVAEAYYKTKSLFDGHKALSSASRDARRWMLASYLDLEAGSGEASKVIQGLQAYVLSYGEYLRTLNDYNLQVMELRKRTGQIK